MRRIFRSIEDSLDADLEKAVEANQRFAEVVIVSARSLAVDDCDDFVSALRIFDLVHCLCPFVVFVIVSVRALLSP